MLSNTNKIGAIAWAAKKERLTYGEFSAKLDEKQKMEIYEQFEEKLRRDKEEEEARLAKAKVKGKKSKVGSVAWEVSKRHDKGLYPKQADMVECGGDANYVVRKMTDLIPDYSDE